MQAFPISKEELTDIVSTFQKRTLAQQIEMLASFGQCSYCDQWILKGLRTHLKNGISNQQNDVKQRINFFGSNQKKKQKQITFFQLVIEAVDDFILKILLVAAAASIIIQVSTASTQKRSTAWIEGFAIFVAVFICVMVTAVNNYQKQKQFIKLNQKADERKMVTVTRKSIVQSIHMDKLLVGDIVKISEGMIVPADGYLLQANQITTDQSAMTGQTQPMKKDLFQKCRQKMLKIKKNIQNGDSINLNSHTVPSPIIISGTKILTGEGCMVVIAVGDFSVIGKIMALLQTQEEISTPLQQKLQIIAQDIGKFGLYSAILIFVILMIRFSIQKIIQKTWNNHDDFAQILEFIILSITVIVVAIPQGLPLAVTLSLAFSVKKMLNDNNLVRKLQACETMGGADSICSDKTGTLTLNKMTVTSYWNQSMNTFDLHNNIVIEQYFIDQKFRKLFIQMACLNTSAILRPEEKGSSTEIAMLRLAQRMGFDYQNLRNSIKFEHKFPFSSKRKRMSVIIQQNNQKIILLKGASQILLNSCKFWHNSNNGQVKQIDWQTLQEINLIIKKMAEKALRTLCIAYKIVKNSELNEGFLQKSDQQGVFQIQKSNFIMLGILGIEDIPRQEVPQAIQKCKKAGIKVRMVTGDNIETAKAIAKKVGIIDNSHNIQDDSIYAMLGSQFMKIIGGVICKECRISQCDCPRFQRQVDLQSQSAEENLIQKNIRVDTIQHSEEFDRIIQNLVVLARSRPEDKYALVTGLKQKGHIVAVTGDGTNDGPALKKADVGFAMGITGTQVAMQASDIILLDDNFNSIVKAVLWGRNIYDSIRKFIQFQLTVNVVAVASTIIGASLLKQQVLKPIQMLWINLIMDTLASLALATQPPTQKLLNRPPHSRDDYIISKTMMKNIIGQSIFQIIVILILVFCGQYFIPEYPDSYDNIPGFHYDYKYSSNGNIRNGRQYFVNGDHDYKNIFEITGIYSRHFTFIFNTFVFMQVFNFLNSRKIQNQLNIFQNLSQSPLFVFIVAIIVGLQILIVTFGGVAFGLYSYYGLTIEQWGISIGISSISLLVSAFLKCLSFKCQKIDHSIQNQITYIEKNSSLRLIQQRFNNKKFSQESQNQFGKTIEMTQIEVKGKDNKNQQGFKRKNSISRKNVSKGKQKKQTTQIIQMNDSINKNSNNLKEYYRQSNLNTNDKTSYRASEYEKMNEISLQESKLDF